MDIPANERPGSEALEMAHVLFMDIVRYTKLPLDHQRNIIRRLQDVVASSSAFIQAKTQNQLISLHAGDGMALVFFKDTEAAARCAVEVSQALRASLDQIPLRMGLHTGPVYRTADINSNNAVAGGGINIAQRVMDCGDAGHILVSGAAAEVLTQVSTWEKTLHDLGEAEAKHGVRLHVYNLYNDEVGNQQLPKKMGPLRATSFKSASRERPKQFSWATMVSVVLIITLLAAAGGWLFYASKAHALTDKDTIVVADFTNRTGDAVFDDTLRQALAIDLEQSPYLNIFPDVKMQQTLKLMGRSPQQRITDEIAREICVRNGLKAELTGSIASLGSQYVVTLKAINAATGDLVGDAQSEASSKEQVLKAVDDAALQLRRRLGESLSSVQKFDTPIEQATTPSLTALQAYSLGYASFYRGDRRAAVPFFQRAIELDPNFAMAYARLGTSFLDTNESDRALSYHQKAFDLSQNVSEAEKFYILDLYYFNVTGDLEREQELLQLWIKTYPRALSPHGSLAYLYNTLFGEFEEAADESRAVLRFEPDNAIAQLHLAVSFMAMNRYGDARPILEKIRENEFIHFWRYCFAALEGDKASAQREVQWAENNEDYIS